jgi:hypothetical protein
VQQHVQKQVRLASAIMSMFGIGFAVATEQQSSAGWRQSQRRKLHRRTG